MVLPNPLAALIRVLQTVPLPVGFPLGPKMRGRLGIQKVLGAVPMFPPRAAQNILNTANFQPWLHIGITWKQTHT